METNIRSFVPIQKLGQGSFASVYKVKRICDNQIYALKKIRMNHLPTKSKQNSLNQVRLLASLQSPYITKYYEAFFDQEIECLCIVMEEADQGDLRKLINSYKSQNKKMIQSEIWKLLIHLLHGLKVLHSNDILHRDLKCQNIFISEGVYKIGDMNVSKINKNGLVETQTGTPYYASPEVWKDQPYNQKSDIWSLGCILYEMTTFRPPFSGTNLHDLHNNIIRGVYNPIPKLYSNQLAQIIGSCLKMSASQRPGVTDLLSNWSLKMYENICIDYKIKSARSNVNMLKTIALPKNIKELNKNLPKSNYNTQEKDQFYGQKEVTVKKKDQTPIKAYQLQEQEKQIISQAVESVPQEVIYYNRMDFEEEIVAVQQPVCVTEPAEPQYKRSENRITENTQSVKDRSSQPQLFDAMPLFNKKVCSLEEIAEPMDKNPQKQPSDPKKQADNGKSLQEIQSFNRLIERIKSSSKPQSQKVDKVERAKSRRTLKDINNKIYVEPIMKSKSRSMKRTQRSMSRQNSRGQPSQTNRLRNNNLNYKIFVYSDRKGENANRLSQKYNQNVPVSNKYTKILQDAKTYLRRSASKHKKLF